MKIRPATIDDKTAIVELYNLFVQGANKEEHHYKTDEDHNLLVVLKEPNSHILVAEFDEDLVGFITFSLRFVVRFPKPIVQVDELFVHANYRRQGGAKKLLNAVEVFAQQQQAQAIYIESRTDLLPAHQFYEAGGYKKSGYYFKKSV